MLPADTGSHAARGGWTPATGRAAGQGSSHTGRRDDRQASQRTHQRPEEATQPRARAADHRGTAQSEGARQACREPAAEPPRRGDRDDRDDRDSFYSSYYSSSEEEGEDTEDERRSLGRRRRLASHDDFFHEASLRFPERIFTEPRPELCDILTTLQVVSTMQPLDLRGGLDRSGAFASKLRDVVCEWCWCNAAFRRTVTRRAERGQPLTGSGPDTPVEYRRDARRQPGSDAPVTVPDQHGALSPARPPRSQASSNRDAGRPGHRDSTARDGRPAPARHGHSTAPRDTLGGRSRSGR